MSECYIHVESKPGTVVGDTIDCIYVLLCLGVVCLSRRRRSLSGSLVEVSPLRQASKCHWEPCQVKDRVSVMQSQFILEMRIGSIKSYLIAETKARLAKQGAGEELLIFRSHAEEAYTIEQVKG